MIRIQAVYVGNTNESYIEARFNPGMNIIFSKKNNVGKTIVTQSIMYVMGAAPTFAMFDYQRYIYILDLNIDGQNLSILRNHNTFIVRRNEEIQVFESARDFQQFWSENITELPTIAKDGSSTQVGLELYTQLAFVAQDSRSSSNINAGRFKKDDFLEMVYAMVNLDAKTLDSRDVTNLKAKRDEFKGRRKGLAKQAKAIQQKGTPLSYISPTADRAEKQAMLAELDIIKGNIARLRKQRNKARARQKKNEAVLTELRSLNIEVGVGSVVCLDCGSTSIGYKMNGTDYVFDITTADVRQQIIGSIEERIDGYAAEVRQTEEELLPLQEQFETLIAEKDVTLADVIAYQEDYKNEKEIDRELTAIDAELERIKGALESNRAIESELKEARGKFRTTLLATMDSARTIISPDQKREPYGSIFTTNTSLYSGSDETEYFLSREYALAICLQHKLPVLIESFRAEDLSTEREENAIKLMTKLGNQVILTTTVKREEGSVKYGAMAGVNSIDYSGYTQNKLLSNVYQDTFIKKLEEFNVVMAATSQ